MATTIISLGTALTSATFVGTDLTKISISVDGSVKTLDTLTTTVTATTIAVSGYGTFSKNAAGDTQITFTADAAYPGGAVELVNGTVAVPPATFLGVNFSTVPVAITGLTGSGAATLTSIIGGVGADSLTSTADNAVIDGGAGNDTITATGSASMTGGLGEDQFVQGTTAKKITVVDYNYAEKDTVKLAGTYGATYGAAALTANVFTSGDNNAAVTVADLATDGAYKIKVTDSTGTPVTKEFWTAKSASTVTLDGSAKTDALVIDVQKTTNAVVTGGYGADTMYLKDSQVTLNAGKNGGIDTINNFDNSFTGDVLNLSGATLSDVTFGNLATGVTFGTTQLKGVGGSDTKGDILVQENGGTNKKVSYAVAAAQSLDASKGADFYIGNATTTLDGSKVAVDGTINLADTTKYKGIVNVKGFTNAAGTYVGNTTTVDTFDLSLATKASQVWGGVGGADVVSLNAVNNVQDVMWSGTTDGADKVSGFKSGFAATSDVVYLRDVADVTKLTFADSATNTKGVLITSATANSLDLVDASNAALTGNAIQLQVKTQDGTVKKVALGAANAIATINGVGADVVIGHATKQDIVAYAGQTTNATVNLLDTAVYKNIEDVDLSGATGAYNVVVGSATLASDITLAGATSEVWGGSNQINKIKTGAGVDTIWFGANDGADVVDTGLIFNNVIDKVKFYDQTVASLAKAYTWDQVNAKFVSTANVGDSLLLTGVTAKSLINVVDKNNNAVKVEVGAAGGAALNYNKDVKVYMGAASELKVTGNDNVVLYLGNGVDATVNDTYFSGVTSIDASTATGQTVLIGSAAKLDQLKGGTTSSAMWGGGLGADDMQGAATAVDEFWFGTGDGNDTASAGVDKKDKVVLYNIASINDVTMTADFAAGTFVIAAGNNKLTVTDATGTNLAALDGGLTFQVGVNEGAKNYTYNRISKSFTAK